MTPHPPVQPRYRSDHEKPAYVNQLFDAGARDYDRVVDLGFLRSGAWYRRWALQRNGLKPGHQLLDVACGTGLVATAAQQILGSADAITCLDPSEGMLSVAKTKLAAHFVIGRAERLPFPDNTFDFLTMGYALRHVTSLEDTFREYRRVLKPGGRVLILEVTKPRSGFGAWLFKLYFGKLYPAFALLITGHPAAREMMRYYWETMDTCVLPESVLDALKSAGFADAKRRLLLRLFSEYTATK